MLRLLMVWHQRADIEDGVVVIREGRSKIMRLKMLLKRSQGRAIVNFNGFHAILKVLNN